MVKNKVNSGLESLEFHILVMLIMLINLFGPKFLPFVKL